MILALATTVAVVGLYAGLPPIEVANKVAKAVKIESPSVAPVIDGEMDAVWADAGEWNTIASYIPNGTSFTEPSGPADISGKWRALWDANNLYIYIEVTDDALVMAPKNDFEIYASTAYTRESGVWDGGYGLTDAHLIFDVGAPTIRAVAGLYSVDSGLDPFPTTTKVKATATGYTAEVALTWTSLNKEAYSQAAWNPTAGLFIGGPSTYEERNFIGFELHLQDDDDGGNRDTKVAWFGGPESRHGDYAWADTEIWGTLELGYKTCNCGASIFGSDCPSQWVPYDGGYRWNEGTGFIYVGFYPYVYAFDANNWFYVFSDPSTSESTGYFIYDFGRQHFGWLNCSLYSMGYIDLPGRYSYTKLRTPVPVIDMRPQMPPIEVANKVATAMKIEAPSVAPKIDGEMDAVWADAAENTIASYIPNGTAFTEPSGLSDISGKWRALWDANNLYIYLEVMDDFRVFSPFNTFEIYTSTAYTRWFGEWANPGYSYSDAHLIFDVGATPIRAVASGNYSVDSGLDPFPTTTKVKPTATGYTAEVALSWTSLNKDNAVNWSPDDGLFIGGPSEYQARNFIGFEIQLQDEDDDAIRDTKVAWYGGPEDRHGDYAWADTQVWGTLKLGSYSPPPVQSVIGTGCADQWAVYYGDIMFKWNPYTDYIYDGLYPFVYSFASNNWFYFFADETTDEAAGYIIYDFGRAQYGWLSCDLYRWGYLVLPRQPAGDTYVLLRTPLP
ncbi:MAG: sugar-binding protein [Verrucomicrobiota bacterium]|nr:sugar-binding protein [Verrucomicrobiota bacterium]